MFVSLKPLMRQSNSESVRFNSGLENVVNVFRHLPDEQVVLSRASVLLQFQHRDVKHHTVDTQEDSVTINHSETYI